MVVVVIITVLFVVSFAEDCVNFYVADRSSIVSVRIAKSVVASSDSFRSSSGGVEHVAEQIRGKSFFANRSCVSSFLIKNRITDLFSDFVIFAESVEGGIVSIVTEGILFLIVLIFFVIISLQHGMILMENKKSAN